MVPYLLALWKMTFTYRFLSFILLKDPHIFSTHRSIFFVNRNLKCDWKENVFSLSTFRIVYSIHKILLFWVNFKSEVRSTGTKLGCVIRMVVDSLLLHAESGPNDHRKDAPLFRPFIFESSNSSFQYEDTCLC